MPVLNANVPYCCSVLSDVQGDSGPLLNCKIVRSRILDAVKSLVYSRFELTRQRSRVGTKTIVGKIRGKCR